MKLALYKYAIIIIIINVLIIQLVLIQTFWYLQERS